MFVNVIDLISSTTSLRNSPVPAIKALPATAPVQIPRFEHLINLYQSKFRLTSVGIQYLTKHIQTHMACRCLCLCHFDHFHRLWVHCTWMPQSFSKLKNYTKCLQPWRFCKLWVHLAKYDKPRWKKSLVSTKAIRKRLSGYHVPSPMLRWPLAKPMAAPHFFEAILQRNRKHWLHDRSMSFMFSLRLLHYSNLISSNNTSASSTTGLWAEEPTEAQGA